MHRFLPIIAFLFLSIYVHLWHVASIHFGTAKYTRGLCFPHHGVISPNTFTSAAPRTYSTICIGSESCLGSIVGFARLPCFGTLRSAISTKVALGELLRLCPSWAGSSTSVEKAKTDCHDDARAGRCSRGFRVPKDLCRLERGVGPVWLKACIAPRIQPSKY